jgi:AAHS family 3-hydroxyphenylpropionic acid transporter
MIADGASDSDNHVPTIVLCLLAAMCEGIDLQVAGVAAAGIVPEFRPSPQWLSYFFSASTLGLFAGALVGGHLSDRLGRKPVLVWSVAMFGLFSLLTVFAANMTSLSLMRLLTGLGLGGAYPNMIALVSEASATSHRKANVTLVFAGTPIGGALVSLGSFLLSPVHWRWLFVFGALAPLIIVPIMALHLRESPAFGAQRAAVAAGAIEAPSGLAGFAAIMTGGRAMPTVLLWCSFFLALTINYLFLSWMPTLLVNDGLSKPQAALAQIAFNVGGASAALGIGRLLEGRWRRLSVVSAFVGLPVFMLLLAAVSKTMIVVMAVFAIGCCILSGLAFLYAVAPLLYPTSIRGTGVGAAVASGRIGSVVGPLLGGALMALGHSSGHLLVDLVPVAVLTGVCAITLAWRR